MTADREITRRLVAHAARSRFHELSPEAVAASKVFILDSLGVALSGSRVPLIAALKETAATWGAGDAARVWGSGERVPAPAAAVLHGWQIHNQEWDCVHEPAVVHPMAVVLATLVAFAESRGGIDGRQLVTGVSVAVDVATGVGRAARNKLRFFRPAMCGALGATAGMANMLGLDEDTTRSALGLAYSQLSGTMQAHIEGSPVLPMQIGFNARAALLAIELATRGIVGPGDFLEGVHGYFTLIDPEWDPAAFDGFEARRAVTELSHKPFPSGRATHGGVDGLLTLQSRLGFGADDLESAVVHAPPLVIQLVDRPARPGMAPAYARLCLPYVAATALLTGDVGVADFEPAALDDPRRHALAARIRAQRDANPSLNALAPQRVEVALRDGSRHALDLPAVLGAPGRPLDRERHLAKFRRAAASAARPLAPEHIEALIGLVDRLDGLDDVRRLVDALVPT
jgi:2-methylcitrate dehydratase PrpD